jgi:hypothetical protein
LNNLIEQDHLRIKQRLRPMLGRKSFETATRVIGGIELAEKDPEGTIQNRKVGWAPSDASGDLAGCVGRLISIWDRHSDRDRNRRSSQFAPEPFSGRSSILSIRGVSRFVSVDELFARRHFDGETVVLCVRWYLSFKLSYLDLVSMMSERGIGLAHTAILRWVQQHYIPEFEKRWKRYARRVCGSWRMDETYVKVRGEWVYLLCVDRNQ